MDEKKRGNIDFKMKSKRGQVSVFIIIAIIIVVGVILFFVLKSTVFKTNIPKQFESAYSYYLSCIDAETINGALLLGQGAGYIEKPEFSPGSVYMPFSSQLNFMGTGVPYWYYISGSGVKKEQVPSIEKMQSQLDDFLKKQIKDCNFESIKGEGFEIMPGTVKNVQTTIKDDKINVKVSQDVIIRFGNSSWIGNVHIKEVNSNLGNFYSLAKKMYLYEKNNSFLENYGVDILRLYAPVDGIEMSCSPKIWSATQIRNNLTLALEANIPAMKVKGDYYSLAKEDNKYFVTNIGENVQANVNFMYSRYWPLKMEVWPADNDLMKADPVGNQEGMGILGFCYVPYHFVYDFAYPVLIQIYYEDEFFQFPVVSYIEKNKPKQGLDVQSLPNVVQELCQYKLMNMSVYTYNTSLDPIQADVSFKCFDTTCSIGRTISNGKEAILTGGFPQCVNGYVIASALGYETKKYIIESLNENNIQIVLDKKYNLDLEVQKEGRKINDYSIITFNKANKTTTVAYPEQKEVDLTEGQYEVKVYVYSDSEINLQGSTSQKCVDVPKSGFMGILGFNEQKCFDLDIPDQTINTAISGGGKQNYYVTQSELESSKKVVINTQDFGTPTKIEELQNNYNLVDNSRLDVNFE